MLPVFPLITAQWWKEEHPAVGGRRLLPWLGLSSWFRPVVPVSDDWFVCEWILRRVQNQMIDGELRWKSG